VKNIIFLIVIALSIGIFYGCADMDAPNPGQILANPLGAGSVKVGMTRNEVLSIYGDPDRKETVTSDEWSGEREEWFYNAEYTALPVNAGFLAKNLYIYFDGDNVTNIRNTPLETTKKDVK
jgi:outer membrane protein assembly factor BamE (lipoprotein component of BamABCDE complex)